jgi:hypothetical protein
LVIVVDGGIVGGSWKATCRGLSMGRSQLSNKL